MRTLWNGASFVVAALALVVGFSLWYVKLSGRESMIVLHFMAGRNADALGTPGDVLGMLGMGTFVLAANAMLKAALGRRHQGLGDIAGIMAATAALLILIAILGIISVN